MTVVPVISRELRASARQPFTYYLRILGVAALMLAGFLFGIDYGFGSNLGGRLFGSLHFALFCSIWLLVPLLTADSISRERREGTLGLLFLTHLTGPAVVIAKGTAHGLRAASLWLAVIPVALIPIMQGGVSEAEVLLSIFINFSSICWALTAGLLASAWSKRWRRSLAWACLLSLIFLLALAMGIGVVWTAVLNPGWMYGWESRLGYAIAMGFSLLTDSAGDGHWADWLRLVPTSRLIWCVAQVGVASLLLLTVAVIVAGEKVRRSWQDRPVSEIQRRLQRVLFTPVFWVGLLKRWMQRKLERNPVGWLEQRTWSGRLVSWGWLAVMISLYCGVLADRRFFGAYSLMHEGIAWLLAASLAMSAAGSFRRERETGLLELLLVSPLSERQIILGRLRGLWGQFLPAFTLLFVLWFYFSSVLADMPAFDAIAFHVLLFACLPVIGLYCSLRFQGYITAVIATLSLGLFLPLFAPTVIWSLSGAAFMPVEHSGVALRSALIELALTGCCWAGLHARLKQRRFAYQRS